MYGGNRVPGRFDFYCKYCGKDFGNNVIKLARHIGRCHDQARS